MADFITQIGAAKPALQAWGRHVIERIQDLVRLEVGDERAALFFKLPPTFRVKDESSAARKQQSKKYEYPLEQMTDLVGARFVVLLRTDLELLERVILAHTGWTASRERHFEFEAAADPETFDYQSIHLLRISAIVDARFRLIVDGVSSRSWTIGTRASDRVHGISVVHVGTEADRVVHAGEHRRGGQRGAEGDGPGSRYAGAGLSTAAGGRRLRRTHDRRGGQAVFDARRSLTVRCHNA